MTSTTGALVPVWFLSPEGFTPVALDEDPLDRSARLAELVDNLYPQVAAQEKLKLVAGSEALLQGLIEKGAVYFASFIYKLDDATICSGMATAFMVDRPPPGGVDFAGRLVKEVHQRYPGEEVDAGLVVLPAGKAALVTRDVLGPPISVLLAPDDQAEPEVLRQLEAYLPFPDGSAYLQIAIGTGDLEAWNELLPVIGGFLAGISFSPYVPKPVRSREAKTAADDWARREFG